MKICAIYDKKAVCYLPPFAVANRIHAVRSFEQACKDPSSDFNKYSGDFALYEIGDFDQDTGVCNFNLPALLLHEAVEFVSSSEK